MAAASARNAAHSASCRLLDKSRSRYSCEFVFYPPIAIDRVDGAVDIARSPGPLNAKVGEACRRPERVNAGDLDLIVSPLSSSH